MSELKTKSNWYNVHKGIHLHTCISKKLKISFVFPKCKLSNSHIAVLGSGELKNFLTLLAENKTHPS